MLDLKEKLSYLNGIHKKNIKNNIKFFCYSEKNKLKINREIEKLYFTKINTSDFQKNSSKAKQILIIMTEMIKSTLGDINAARKLILNLKRNYPSLKIQWIIRKNTDFSIPDEILQCADNTLVIDTWEVSSPYTKFILNKTLLLRGWFYEAGLVLSYPVPIRLSAYSRKSIKKLLPLKTKMIDCLEYDVVKPDPIANSYLCTGFSPDSLGIFIESFPITTIAEIISHLKDPTMINFLGNPNPVDYEKDHAFFLAYFNQEVERTQNRVNAKTFCAIIAAYTRKANVNQCQLDIVCPFTDGELKTFLPKQLFKENINKIIIFRENETLVFENPNPKADGRVVKILTKFKFDPTPFSMLMLLAYYSAITINLTPFIGCTGDQSLSEVFSLGKEGLPGAIFFYQVMDWKKEIPPKILQSAKNYFSDWNNLLFYLLFMFENDPFRFKSLPEIVSEIAVKGEISMDSLPNLMGFNSRSIQEANENYFNTLEKTKEDYKNFVNIISDYLIDPKVTEAMSQLCFYLRREKNLYNNLPKKIIEIITHSYPKFTFTSNEIIKQEIETTRDCNRMTV